VGQGGTAVTGTVELIVTLPATPALRRQQIRLQIALIGPLFHVKGYSALEPKEAVERLQRSQPEQHC
jgi:hypothetical protein